MASVTDETMEALEGLGYTEGSISDRLFEFYKDECATALIDSTSMTSADMQIALDYPKVTDMREVEEL